MSQQLNEVDQDVAASPLARVHAAEKVNARTIAAAALSDLERMADAVLPRLPGQRYQPGE